MAATSVSSLTGVTAYDGAASVGQGVFSVTKSDLASLLDSARVSSQESTTSLQSLISGFDQAAGASGTMTLAQFRAYVAENGYTLGGTSTQRASTSSTSSAQGGASTRSSTAPSSTGTSQSGASAGSAGASTAAGASSASGTAGSSSASAASSANGTSSTSSTDATEELATMPQAEVEILAAAGDQDAIKELERRAALYGGNALLQSFTAQSSGSRFSAYA